jgi:hypothetical protein
MSVADDFDQTGNGWVVTEGYEETEGAVAKNPCVDVLAA